MNIEEAEQTQLRDITALGLTCEVVHTRFEKPTLIEPYEAMKPIKGAKKAIAMTTVMLVVRTKGPEKGDGTREPGTVSVQSIGRALCSHKDQFSKRSGRVIATARALESLS